MPATFTGVAVNVAPWLGTDCRFVRCSTMGIPAASNRLCAGRSLPAVESMFSESIPTKATPASISERTVASSRNA